MSETKSKNEGRVNIALGPPKLKELATLAKRHGTSRGALGRAFILQGMDDLKSGKAQVTAGVSIGKLEGDQ